MYKDTDFSVKYKNLYYEYLYILSKNKKEITDNDKKEAHEKALKSLEISLRKDLET